MRSIGTLSNQNFALKFSTYLTKQGIGNSYEPAFDPANGHMYYEVWIHDEDRLEEASTLLKEFEKSPSELKYELPSIPKEVSPPVDLEVKENPEPHRFGTHLTNLLISFCVFLFFLNSLQQIPLRDDGLAGSILSITPVQSSLMYDFPAPFDQIEQIVKKYELSSKGKEKISPQIKMEVKAIEDSTYWRGVYDWIVLKLKGEDTSEIKGELFTKIRQGEIWRLFTPCLLHTNFLHIFFNMLWLWYLGRPIEQRVGPSRTLLLTLVAGIGANTLQYLMSGPFFIGYSGVVTGLAGFIWMRGKVAPWEGYPLNRSTVLFLLIFILSIFALQLVSFFMEVFTTYNFTPNIANTAHIAGAVIGAILGRFSFFAQRVHK